ncbi:MAG: SRPBCC family protein [Bacteroidales bacterium]
MKVLKWIFIIVGGIVTAALIIALFLPKKVNVTSSIDIDQSPAKVFHSVALFNNREAWDPWVSEDSTTRVDIFPRAEYVGSTYEWEGEAVGTGKMQVDSIAYAEYISSRIWFGGQPEPAKVSWEFTPVNGNTNVKWGFHADASYPLGRLFLNLMKGSLQDDLDKGLQNLKNFLDGKEIKLSTLSEITKTEIPSIVSMVAKTSGTMEEIISEVDNLIAAVMETVDQQNLDITGNPFCYYTDYNPEDETTTLYCGIPVREAGEPTDDVMPVTFPESKAIMAIHTGPYDEFTDSYTALMQYVDENKIPVNWNAWEFYINDPMELKYPTLYKTKIYFETE